MERKCLKCGFVKDAARGDSMEPCPRCGAIYSRVEAAAAAGAPVAGPALKRAMTRRRDDFCDPQTFAVRMRKESLYPASRSLTQMAYLLGLALAALWVVGGLINIFTSRASDRILTLAVCLFIAVATIFLSRLFREISLMLCDLSDASIRTAAHFEQS